MVEQPPFISIEASWTGVLFPLHVLIGCDGRIKGVGPTMAAMLDKGAQDRFFDTFTIVKPRNIADVDAVRDRVGTRLMIEAQFGDGQTLQLRGVACPVAGTGDILMDLAIGYDLSDAIERFGLTSKDFKPNDFSVDMFYTFETQKALLEDSQKLTTALALANEDAERSANVDFVTCIANRRAMQRHIDQLVKTRDETDYAMLHIDLDNFRSVNDSFGHATGDAFLKFTAQCLAANTEDSAFVARLGGDEFAVITPAPNRDDALINLARSLIDRISQPQRNGDHVCKVGASVGIARFNPAALDNPEQPLADSDIALFCAKAQSAPVVLLTDEMIAEHMDSKLLVEEIRTGIHQQQFVPYFQPQVDLANNSVHGVEVLARWRHPVRGILPPGLWLDVAEKAGLMPVIDRDVLAQSIEIFAKWRRGREDPLRFSFNLTEKNLRSVDFLETLEDWLLIAEIPKNCVQVELLESILFNQADNVLFERCNSLADSGFALALDDFGTGQTSIATLIDAPISTLKIDRSFVTGLDSRPNLQRITKSILAMSEQLGLNVVAEGIETTAELSLIASFGCRFGQGYLFSQPLDAAGCKNWIDACATSGTFALAG